MPLTQYTVGQNERWDNVAYLMYADPTRVEDIIRANPTVPIRDIIPANTVLNIPIEEPTEAASNNLPPWKR